MSEREWLMAQAVSPGGPSRCLRRRDWHSCGPPRGRSMQQLDHWKRLAFVGELGLHIEPWTHPENISMARSSSPRTLRPALICAVYVGVSPLFQSSIIHSDPSWPFEGPPAQIAWPQTRMRWLGGCMFKVSRQRLGQKKAQVARGSACLLSQLNVANQVGSCDRVQEWAFDTPPLMILKRLLLRPGRQQSIRTHF